MPQEVALVNTDSISPLARDAEDSGALESSEDSRTCSENGGRKSFWRKMLATMGPGLMVCFADTDGSCLLTAADSGSQWRYKLLLLQVILVPILFFAQELTVRLALSTGKGLTGLLRHEMGPRWAWAVAVPLLFDAFLALISEINVTAQTMEACWGVHAYITSTLFVLCLLGLALTGSYKIAERVGLAMGVLQVAFFGTMFLTGPKGSEVWNDLWSFPLGDPSYVKLVTANIGAVIMPWMLAYQQTALCQKGVTEEHDPDDLLIERIDTGLGSVLTQAVMAAMLVQAASSPLVKGQTIQTIDQLVPIFTDAMGNETAAKLLLTFAVVGACVVAAIVVTLCGAWALEEALGSDQAQAQQAVRVWNGNVKQYIVETVKDRPTFYIAYATTCIVAWFLSVATPSFADSLTGVTTQFLNGLLMPPVIFALWYLAAYKLPEDTRLSPCYKWFLFVVFGLCSGFCLVSIPFAIEDATN
eukprot:TRINITY_DN109981_c0_g1_i1.p1 TRINITY_DN109981_c0_g1~~TRINITY_DN109981_c0_g1_i1.p1  ORF type:complete len:472 (+),score=59.49 TRINITY_DN109981_c0_g1_i1:132-1547(+)